eukprot:CAMPEP_0172583184 /NCGR_PEP_ID=MMETSP1068-20121228/2786_1 /TAXON_ID=35684 /ORGANISM="Pseudopedinella elastica, Strain CCMP716" /LENGTH=34 /DNA_ID= /DNA_START= /DNA_END= /DNA_ORIENTATION=
MGAAVPRRPSDGKVQSPPGPVLIREDDGLSKGGG